MSLHRCAAVMLALLLAACAAAPGPTIEYFTLAAPNPGVAPAASPSPAVYVGPVSIPEAVDRSEMVLDRGPNQVAISDAYQWAEPLERAIPVVVAQALARELGSSRVMTSREASGGDFDYRVGIEVQRFESSLDDGATIDALWTITTRDDRRYEGRSTVHEALRGSGPAALAGAHSRALVQVAREIADAIRDIRERARPGSA